jgi:hypothetical protein
MIRKSVKRFSDKIMLKQKEFPRLFGRVRQAQEAIEKSP